MEISVPSFAYALSRERRVGRFDRKRNEKLARGGGKRGKGAKREKELWLGGGEPRRAFPLCASSLSRFRAGGQRGRYRQLPRNRRSIMPLDTDEAISYCRAPPRGGKKKRLVERGGGAGSGRARMGEVAHIAGTPLAHVLFIDSKQIRSVYSSSRASSSSQITWSSFSYPSFQGYTFPFRDVYRRHSNIRREISSLRQFYFSLLFLSLIFSI